MIPHRMLSNEISSSGLKDRITACRKRLRESRVLLKAHDATAVEEVFPEIRMNRSSFEGGDLEDNVRLVRLEEQEVGIT
jgi:hypothetical protein